MNKRDLSSTLIQLEDVSDMGIMTLWKIAVKIHPAGRRMWWKLAQVNKYRLHRGKNVSNIWSAVKIIFNWFISYQRPVGQKLEMGRDEIIEPLEFQILPF